MKAGLSLDVLVQGAQDWEQDLIQTCRSKSFAAESWKLESYTSTMCEVQYEMPKEAPRAGHISGP